MYEKYNSKLNTEVITIYSGEYYVTDRDVVLSTILGSCISVCLFDSVNGLSGMNHFMLPKNTTNDFATKDHKFRYEHLNDDSLRYGITSMEILIRELQIIGAQRSNLKAKIFGGGNVISYNHEDTVGKKNIEFIVTFLNTEGIEIVQHDVGLNVGRKILYFTKNNRVFVKKMKIDNINQEPIVEIVKLENNITLFN